MTSLRKIATPVACVAVISGAAILWWVHKQKAIERKKFGEAASISRVGAEQGDARAQFEFASMYYKGKGVRQDYGEAARWLRKAADQGYAKAQYDLGYMYSQGKGLPPDHAEAARWFRKAAKQGDTKAQRALKTRLSTPSKVLITIEFLGTILLLVSSYRSAGGAFGCSSEQRS